MRNISFNYIVTRNDADFGKIWPAQNSAPTIRMSKDSDIKTSLSGTFIKTIYGFDDQPIEGAAVDWLSDKIRPELVIDGVAYPLGIYIPVAVTENLDQSGTGIKTQAIQACDKCWEVQNYIPTQIYFAAGTNYVEALISLLTPAGVALISSTPTSATLQEAREDWNLGTDTLTVVNQLLDEINYGSLWFDKDGLAMLQPNREPIAQNIKHIIDANSPEVLVLPGITATQNIYSAPNVFTVICDNPDKSAAMTATSVNENPQSPLSVQRRGKRIMSVNYVDNIASQSELQAYADRLRNESMVTAETIVVKTMLLPGFGVGDVVGLNYGDRFDICVEKAWTMTLAPGGQMTHTLEKVVVNLE